MSWKATKMRITVLTVPDCPNAPVAQERIAAALDGRAAEVQLVEVREEADAAHWGMTGSPTVLIDGVDPFAVAGSAPSVSCRLYRDADGRTDGAPSVELLRQALAGLSIGSSAVTGEDCCDPDILDPIGRGGRGRRAPVEGGLRAVHQAVLRHFASTGSAPAPAELEAPAATAGRTATQVLAELDREDFLTLDKNGQILAAYPFSTVATRHRVSFADGVQVWSMCAIDALGIAAMLDQDVVISSSDPVTAEPVTITMTGGTTVWEPAGTVVFVGHRGYAGPAAAVCCDALNFFTGDASARTWAEGHPQVKGAVVSQTRAEELGRETFGPLLRDA
ncbi:organomercurial lyase [Streptomyces sp. NPDC048405]|uniref:organomercurial lyase n=1 Tax=Streptomyces TaxID=1883 RepID=UPI001FD15248|nr:organomercurial lyase [Streptomyces coelicoflavus]